MTTTSTSQHVVRVGLSAFMVLAGTSHLTFARREFQAQVPPWLPVDRDAVVLASGVAEIGLGVCFAAMPRRRRAIGVALASFYTAIFPGNVNQYAQRLDAFNLDTDGKRLGRLFFQPALIAGALWGAGLPDRD